MESFRIRIALGLIALSLGLVSGDADTNTIFFRHYSDGSYEDVNILHVTRLIPRLNMNEWTICHLHGFTEDVETDSVTTVVNAYLNGTDYNVIAIDYRKIADNEDYVLDTLRVDSVGVAIAKALRRLKAHGLDPNKIHIVAHSLGAQVAARVGIHMNHAIARITGLDPAGPMFYTGRYLKSGNAKFVDIIHTDMGVLGQVENSGDVDFYPNLGHRPQPGCPLFSLNLKHAICDHSRAWRFYAESILNPSGFLGVKCISGKQFRRDNCDKKDVVPMGFATPTSAGKYYLHTNSESPFAEGLQGI